MEFYLGTFEYDKNGHTVYKATLDKTNKTFTLDPALQAGPKPSYISLNTNKSVFYTVNELDEYDKEFGSITSIQLTNNKENKKISLSTRAYNPCHISISKDESLLFVTNYGGASLCVYSLNKKGDLDSLVQTCEFSGSSVDPIRQTKSYPHSSISSPCGKFLFVADLGCDCLYKLEIDNSKSSPLTLIKSIKTPAGIGPRHMCFSEDYSYLFVCGELSSTVLVYEYTRDNAIIKLKNNYPVFKDYPPYPRTKTAEIAYYNNHVYMSNRGDDTISVIKVLENGELLLIDNIPCGGKFPRNFKIFSETPWGGQGTLVVANRKSNNLTFFVIEGDNLTQVYSKDIHVSPGRVF